MERGTISAYSAAPKALDSCEPVIQEGPAVSSTQTMMPNEASHWGLMPEFIGRMIRPVRVRMTRSLFRMK